MSKVARNYGVGGEFDIEYLHIIFFNYII